jgi:hypothetical protein
MAEEPKAVLASKMQIRVMGWGLILLAFLFAYLFLMLYPSGKPGDPAKSFSLFYITATEFKLNFDQQLILMVMIAGGLGSFIHTATSFSDYVGNEKLTVNWIWFYILRPFIGIVLAVIFYLVIRGGFLSAGSGSDNINPFGISALAALVGMFSKQATDKLNDVFNILFTAKGDEKRKDNLTNPVPNITDIDPKSIEPKTENVVVTVKGTEFVVGTVLNVNGNNRETQFIDATQLTAKLLPEDLENEGELKVTAFNPPPGGGTSPAILIKIAAGAIPEKTVDETIDETVDKPVDIDVPDEENTDSQGTTITSADTQADKPVEIPESDIPAEPNAADSVSEKLATPKARKKPDKG